MTSVPPTPESPTPPPPPGANAGGGFAEASPSGDAPGFPAAASPTTTPAAAMLGNLGDPLVNAPGGAPAPSVLVFFGGLVLAGLLTLADRTSTAFDLFDFQSQFTSATHEIALWCGAALLAMTGLLLALQKKMEKATIGLTLVGGAVVGLLAVFTFISGLLDDEGILFVGNNAIPIFTGSTGPALLFAGGSIAAVVLGISDRAKGITIVVTALLGAVALIILNGPTNLLEVSVDLEFREELGLVLAGVTMLVALLLVAAGAICAVHGAPTILRIAVAAAAGLAAALRLLLTLITYSFDTRLPGIFSTGSSASVLALLAFAAGLALWGWTPGSETVSGDNGDAGAVAPLGGEA